MKDREPTLASVILNAIQANALDMHVMLPGSIESYDSANQTVNVKLNLKNQAAFARGSSTSVSDFPILPAVPVAFQRCAGGWLTWPLAVGDTGMVLFSDASLAEWASAQKGNVTDPKDFNMHQLGGAVFVPGLTPPSSPLSSPSTSHPVLHTESELHLGEKSLSDDQFVALAKLVKDEFIALGDAISAHTHTCPLGGGATTAITFSYSAGEVKATKVKAK